MLAWYDYSLKGRKTGVMEGPPIRYQVSGVKGWRTTEEWPPPESVLTPFALRANGVLALEEGEPGCREYLYLPPDSGEPKNAISLSSGYAAKTRSLVSSLNEYLSFSSCSP